MNIHKTIINYTELLLARMARMTVDEVMERWDDASSEIGDELDDFDDPDEPTMEGSDDEFCDIEDVGGYDTMMSSTMMLLYLKTLLLHLMMTSWTPLWIQIQTWTRQLLTPSPSGPQHSSATQSVLSPPM